MRRRGGRAGFLRADPHPPTTISPERGFSGRKGSTCLARRPRRGLASCGVADHRRDMAYAPPASSTSRPRPARSLPAVQSHCVATNIRGSAIEFGGTIPDRFLSDGRIFSTTRPQKNAIHDLSNSGAASPVSPAHRSNTRPVAILGLWRPQSVPDLRPAKLTPGLGLSATASISRLPIFQ